jgi:hypothetical protein
MIIENSEDTTQFTSADGKFIFVVKTSFMKKLKNWGVDPSNENVYQLMTDHGMASQLHNLSGPAILSLESGKMSFFKDGVQLQEGEKTLHDMKFNKSLMDILDI